jgi:hypothetical protein
MERINSQALTEKVKVCRLLATDILLVHTKRSLWGWLIRFGTHCYWNHALMVCSTGESEQDYRNMLVVDAKTDGTIVMSRVGEYLGRRDKYDLAVKRLEADWFQNENKLSADELRRSICKIAVNEVDFKLGRRLIKSFKQIVRQLTVIFRFIRRKIRGVYMPPRLPWSVRPAQVKAFTCGGFVQWCYYKAVSKMLEERGGDHSLLDDVVFNPRVEQEPTPFELLTTTPADLANCDKLSWKYIIKNGVMQEVSSSHETSLVAMPA